ncbi:MAG: DNA polymerase IV [Candidatus Kerfeldbacteria bacterium]|nr:DNA polymerase IV [Candidatus Kerfeldbacteria bacterium]
MNSYFASVEQQANPHLRGRPVGVVATMSPNGCIIASSTEAKAKGIKTGVRVREARAIDPAIILIPNDAAKYRTVTAGIMRILKSYTEDIELYSIDEAFLNLTGFVKTQAEAAAIGDEIRRRILDDVGEWLRCSIGIAPTRWLAKFGSDVAPKGQTLVLDQSNLAVHLDPRTLTDAWGIAHRLEQRLNLLNIYTLGHLRRAPVANLMTVFGIMGYELWANVNGIEFATVQSAGQPKSIGHSHVFAKRATSLDYPKAILAKLCEKAGRRLRHHQLEAHGLWLGFGLPDWAQARYGQSGGGGAETFSAPLIDTRDIFVRAWRLFMHDLPPGAIPNYLAMTLFSLKPHVDQLELWPRLKHQDAPALAAALDLLNDAFGDFTVTRGTFWGLTERDVPDRIGFRKTAGVDDAGQWTVER